MVSVDQFFVWEVTGLNRVTYDVFARFCCFELDKQKKA